MKPRKSLVIALAVLVAALVLVHGYRAGRQHAIDLTQRTRTKTDTPSFLPPRPSKPRITTWADGTPVVHGPPECGPVYPAIEKWTPEKIDAMLTANPGNEVAHIWATLAFYRQKRWDRYWHTLKRFRPEHHFYQAALRDVKAHRVPPPTG